MLSTNWSPAMPSEDAVVEGEADVGTRPYHNRIIFGYFDPLLNGPDAQDAALGLVDNGVANRLPNMP
jgi:hypothetical protein